MSAASETDFTLALARTALAVERMLELATPAPERVVESDGEARVFAAMRYAVLGGGKRLRAFLLCECANLFDVDQARARRAAAAVECLHAYSLIHDDLPCMDDDAVRHGKPAVHIAFDEATAVLAGDALQALAFEILADEQTHEDPFVRCTLMRGLATAAGAQGMVGGQMIDIAAETKVDPLDIGGVMRLQRLKTGALIGFSCFAGGVMGHADAERLRALDGYAHDLGLAFQIRDDLLDLEGTQDETGKRVGKDAAAGKATFASILGVEGARQRAQMLSAQAIAHLARFGDRAGLLRQAAEFSISRRS